jgi:cytochrome c oxidase subunit 2
MARQHPSKGSAAVSVAIAITLVLITFFTCYFFFMRTWWFPEAITAEGREVDKQFMATLWVTGVTFVASQLALAWVVFRFRNRGQRAGYSHGNNTMEIVWTSATVIVFIGLGFMAREAWASLHFRSAEPGALQIEVTAQQFAWNFRYPGADGIWGRTKVSEISDSGGNPIGLDPSDPAAADDLVMPVFAVPVDREVELVLKTKDVTHSFFVRELRLKQDTVPGMVIRVHFKAEKPGQYEVACAELCGLGHHRMRSFMTVLSQADYAKWLAEQIALKQEELQPAETEQLEQPKQ